MRVQLSSNRLRMQQGWCEVIKGYCAWDFFFTFTYRDLGPRHPEQYAKHLRSFFYRLGQNIFNRNPVPIKLYKIVYCYEFQHRGSVHFHCLVKFHRCMNASLMPFKVNVVRACPVFVLKYYSQIEWFYGFMDVRAIYNDDVIAYISKYVLKSGTADNIDFLF